ncbi:gamma-glutamyl hydrolase [Brevibacillus fluminis]|uniref:Gamma-glutamyl hydrolase n=1 Tax=Brevibacillus fluminis TaxID=511487 RepID=A0A3M8DIH0_9BACL|nr:C40 family peptidase [Brevibacillus fluminis]RNB87808.1 gamma-glutamyl hydrolase [Brevibacillus fluminis]
MTKKDWLKKSTLAVMLSTSLLVFADGGQAFAAQASASDVANDAYDLLGKPYKSSANGPSSFDSAGFITYVMKESGIKLDDSLKSLTTAGKSVAKTDIKQGDILFFKNDSYAGIYVGNDKFLYASKGQGKVVEQKLSKVKSDLTKVRRILDTTTGTTKPETSQNWEKVAQSVIKAGEKYMGTPYQYASSRSDKSTMDCSEFVMWAYKEGANIDLGKGGARSEYKKTKEISRSQLRPGDLVFFSTRATMKYDANDINRIGHVGIYVGDNKVLHTYGEGGVKYSSMKSGWWNEHFVRAGRVIN